jgi:hypothetical protein
MVCPAFDEGAPYERTVWPVNVYTSFSLGIISANWVVSVQGDHGIVEAFEILPGRRMRFLCACGLGFDESTAKTLRIMM